MQSYRVTASDYNIREMAKRFESYAHSKVFNPKFEDVLHLTPSRDPGYLAIIVTGIDCDSVVIRADSIAFECDSIYAKVGDYEFEEYHYPLTTEGGWCRVAYEQWELAGRKGPIKSRLMAEKWFDDSIDLIEERALWVRNSVQAFAFNAEREVHFIVQEMFKD